MPYLLHPAGRRNKIVSSGGNAGKINLKQRTQRSAVSNRVSTEFAVNSGHHCGVTQDIEVTIVPAGIKRELIRQIALTRPARYLPRSAWITAIRK
jgi:hypothetical protein